MGWRLRLLLRWFAIFLLLVLGPWSFGLGNLSSAVRAMPLSRSAGANGETRRGSRNREAGLGDAGNPTRIVVVDDHELARAGIRSVLEGEEDLAVVGEAADGHEAVTACRSVAPNSSSWTSACRAWTGLRPLAT
jgi:PleD family two-component response regulator